MKYIIDTDILAKNNLSLSEFGMLLYYAGGDKSIDYNTINNSLWNKGYIIKNLGGYYTFDHFRFEELQAILAESSNKSSINERAEHLATMMRELFPKGNKIIFAGGIQKKYSWRDCNRTIANRMKIFFKRYGDNFTDEDIINATKRYVKEHENDTTYMKLLKYFIFKDSKEQDGTGDGYVDETSELLSYIENAGQEDTIQGDWVSELR